MNGYFVGVRSVRVRSVRVRSYWFWVWFFRYAAYLHMANRVVNFCYFLRNWSTGGGGVHNMLRVRVCAAHIGGFLDQNSLDKGLSFGKFSINMGGISRNWRK